jgi:cobalt-zinc-cadmium resistance protein CzcA
MAVSGQLPPGVQPELGPLSTGLSEAYQYYLVPQVPVSLTELRAVQDWTIRRFLLQVPGVADVSSFGGYVRRWEIVVELAALSRYGLTLVDLERALLQSNQLVGVGYIEKQAQTIALRVDGLWRSPADIYKA